MQIKVYSNDGIAEVSVVDPSDGAVAHNVDLEDGQTITITATSAHSPADIEFGEVEAIPSDEPAEPTERADASVVAGASAAASSSGGFSGEVMHPGEGAEGAEAPADDPHPPTTDPDPED